ncbi:FecR family protein [Dysgonomonas sp. Marseille-P4677]|uniref:FecR family protein n=1 Tax=Dysgonomonas sp. Marseille-P4677 TaxID=2364790 RepID=UPI0019139328|nr:FecR family protein [Dysgonomonas sp. Marseille-P4677]MBK5720008.1 FecR family protein [Dysgonomonas sp. Marseille-P4677]
MEKYRDIDEHKLTLIIDFLEGTISARDNDELQLWLSESELHVSYFEEIEKIYHSIEYIKESQKFDKDRAFNLFRERIELSSNNRYEEDTQTDRVIDKSYSRKTLLKVAAIAATIALITGFSFSLFHIKSITPAQKEVTVESPPGQKTKLFLPDGTLVWLNSGTKITYNTDYGVDNRNIEMEGEAFFDVTRNENLNFKISINDIEVSVLGTSFDVEAYRGDKEISVSVINGRVSVGKINDKVFGVLKPNEKIVINKDDNSFKLKICDPEIDGIWRHGQLKIINDPMPVVISKMERWYGVKITIEGQMSHENYWLTIKTESLTEILELINRITPINYQIKGEEVTIKYK